MNADERGLDLIRVYPRSSSYIPKGLFLTPPKCHGFCMLPYWAPQTLRFSGVFVWRWVSRTYQFQPPPTRMAQSL